ncbi:MAG: hypothetical protein SPF09_03535 [Bacteroidaceae bacterium]|nr:hypothetical protein [Bacteroidaceae bacterium]
MKKNYITPEINVIQPEALLCSGGLVTTSVFQESTEGECIGKFDVVNEDASKTDYKDLWGSGNWGED